MIKCLKNRFIVSLYHFSRISSVFVCRHSVRGHRIAQYILFFFILNDEYAVLCGRHMKIIIACGTGSLSAQKSFFGYKPPRLVSMAWSSAIRAIWFFNRPKNIFPPIPAAPRKPPAAYHLQIPFRIRRAFWIKSFYPSTAAGRAPGFTQAMDITVKCFAVLFSIFLFGNMH